MNLCKNCHATLVCEHVPVNRSYQCPVCGYPNSFGTADGATELNKLSRRSLLCGLGTLGILAIAIGLLFADLPMTAGLAGPAEFLLGAVAFYYGIQAFLRSRYQPFSKRSKYEAVTGILGGSLLGIIVGAIITMILVVATIAQWFTSETTDLAEVASAWNSTAQMNLPESVELVPYLARKTPVRRRIEFWDNKSFEDSRNRFYLLWTNSIYTSQWGSREQNRNNLREASSRFISGGLTGGNAQQLKSSKVNWQIHRESRTVQIVHWQGRTPTDSDDPSSEFITYQCLFDANKNTYCLTFFSLLPDPDVDESEIQTAFESFVPVGTGW